MMRFVCSNGDIALERPRPYPAFRPLLVGISGLIMLTGPACGPTSGEPNVASIQSPVVGGLADTTVATAGQIVNRYASLTNDAAGGATTITVSDAGALMAAPDDLLFIVQMQGAEVDGSNTSTFGTVTALNGAGLFELVTLANVNGNTLTLAAGCGLRNGYSASAHTQVIWVPQYQSLSVPATASITAPAWDGTTGGAIVIQAQSVTLGGSIDASEKGFRGGALSDFAQAPPTTSFQYRSIDPLDGAEKGESIAGYEADYDAPAIGGRYSLGAIANGGGGGAAHNGGGGGGANGNDGNGWSGLGVMPATVTGASAWLLDTGTQMGAGLAHSSGGGRGGYSFSENAEDPTHVAPGDVRWGGDDRQYRGGLGGRPLANDAIARLFLGGGGGAGNENNGSGGAGAPGGGIVYLIAGAVSGMGTIHADGAPGSSTPKGNGLGNDAPGGGGGGGSIVVAAPSLGAVTVTANGGAGGDQFIEGFGNEAEGPGGGGGGGFISVPSGTVTTPVGGVGGTTDSPALAKFPRNGATDGAGGTLSPLGSSVVPPMCIAADLSVAMSDGGGTVTAGTNVTFAITVTNNGPNPVAGATLADPFGAAFTGETWTCAGAGCPATTGVGNPSAALGLLAPGAQAIFTVVASVSPGATGVLSNTATVSAPPGIVDGVPGNNTVTITNTLNAVADVSVALTAPPSVAVGASYSYTVNVLNAGPSAASQVTATLTIPNGATLGPLPPSDAAGGWTCTVPPVGQTVTCVRTTLAAGANVPLTLDVTAPTDPGAATATATVSSATDDPTAANDRTSLVIQILCVHDADCGPSDSCSAAGSCVPNQGGSTADAGWVDASADADAASDGAAETADGGGGRADGESGAEAGGPEGSALDGSALDGSALDGSALDGSALDESEAAAATDTGLSPSPSEAGDSESETTDTGRLEGGGISCSAASAPRRAGGPRGLFAAFALVGLWAERRRRAARGGGDIVSIR
jgi:large repetitive protein